MYLILWNRRSVDVSPCAPYELWLKEAGILGAADSSQGITSVDCSSRLLGWLKARVRTVIVGDNA